MILITLSKFKFLKPKKIQKRDSLNKKYNLYKFVILNIFNEMIYNMFKIYMQRKTLKFI